jgi:SET domain-containing protein
MEIRNISERSIQNRKLYVAKSTLANAGHGLFAKKLIKKGKIVCFLSGEIIDEAEAEKRDVGDRGHYFVGLSSGNILDVYNSTSFGRWANDARHKGRNNCRIYSTRNTKRAYISAIKDIHPDEEILVDYGTQFWEAVEANQ